MATKFDITIDGKMETFTVKPKHILSIERESGGISANIESSYKLAYLATESKLSFEDWLDGVDDIEAVDQEEVAEEADSKNLTSGA